MERQWLNYHHLFYFKTIATEGGIAKAAKKLRLGQPTLSTQLKQFEDHLGHALFERRKKRLYLTEAGRIALDYANEIFKLGDEMQDALADRLSIDRIEVQIGSLDSVPKMLTWHLVEQAQKEQNCTVSIIEGRGDLLRELKAHRLDLVIANHPPPIGEGQGLFTRLVGRYPVLICGAKPFAKLSKGFPESLQGQPFIMPTLHSRLRGEVDQFLRSHHIRVDMVAEVQDTSLHRLMGIHGAGLIPIADQAAADALEHKELFVIGALDNVYEEIWLAASERRIQNPVAAQLMKSFQLDSISYSKLRDR
jgi:LysR family transcriptional activator of nhaA